jgi:hypothetical protein
MNHNRLKFSIGEYMQSHDYDELFDIVIETMGKDSELKFALIQKLYKSIPTTDID